MPRPSFTFFFALALLMVLTLPTVADEKDARSKRLLLVGQGSDGHPPTTHEFMAGVHVLEKLLAPIGDLQTTLVKADEPWPEGPALIDQADGIVMFVTQGAQWMQIQPQRYAALQRLAQRKGAIVALHWAV